jgi:hypothetical protein
VAIFGSLLLVACGTDDSQNDGASDASVSGDGSTNVGNDASISDAASSNDGSITKSDGGISTDGGAKKLSAGCGTTPPHTASYTGSTTDGNGTTRSYDVYLPSAYDSKTPVALTFAFHGAGGSPSSSEAFGIQNATGASAASIFVFPKGIAYETYGVGWDDSCKGRDMPFFDNMLADIESHYCIDESRLFAAGFSWGCDFATALTCCRGNEIRATSNASCTDEYASNTDFTTYDNLACPVKSRTAIRFTHDASGGDSAYPAPLFTTTSKLYQFFNGCPSFTGTLTAGTCHTYAGCTDPFIECPYTSLGHATPANWGADTWTFFDSFK